MKIYIALREILYRRYHHLDDTSNVFDFLAEASNVLLCVALFSPGIFFLLCAAFYALGAR